MERRKTPRTAVRKLAYVNFEPYNTGGVITEISASGLRFHTVAPLEQGGVVRLSLVFAGMNHLEAVGEVVWTDSTRKVGGVRFVVLPPDASAQIRNWLGNSSSGNGIQTGSKTETVRTSEPDALNPSTLSVKPENALFPPASSARPPLSNTLTASTVGPHGWALPGKPGAIFSTAQLDLDPPRRRSAFVRGLVAVLTICLLVPATVWFGLQHYNWLSSWIQSAVPAISSPIAVPPAPTLTNGVLPGLDVSASEQINSGPANPAETASVNAPNPAPSTEQAQSAVSNLSSRPEEPKSAAVTESRQTSAAETKPAPKLESAAPDRIESTQSPSQGTPAAPRNAVLPRLQRQAQPPASSVPDPADNAGEAELILAWQYLEGQGGRPRDPAAASRLLWTSVKKGNLTAETTLANLYLRGEGVPKSCDQARVLLSAASAKGGIEAKQKLRDLKQNGCR